MYSLFLFDTIALQRAWEFPLFICLSSSILIFWPVTRLVCTFTNIISLLLLELHPGFIVLNCETVLEVVIADYRPMSSHKNKISQGQHIV